MEDVGKLVIPYDRGEFFLRLGLTELICFQAQKQKSFIIKRGTFPQILGLQGDLLGIDKISEEESFAITFIIIPFIGGMANCFHRRGSMGIVSRLSAFLHGKR
jgi:hypothetical protein